MRSIRNGLSTKEEMWGRLCNGLDKLQQEVAAKTNGKTGVIVVLPWDSKEEHPGIEGQAENLVINVVFVDPDADGKGDSLPSEG